MTVSTPIDWLLERSTWARKLGAGWLTLIGLGIFVALARPSSIETTASHPGIFQLELAGTSDNALAILRAFSDEALVPTVRRAIFADFGLIIGYVLLISALLSWLAARSRKSDALVGYASWGIVLAGLFDYAEDFAMLAILDQSPELPGAGMGWAAVIATLTALAKWTLVYAIVGYALWELSKFLGGYFHKPRSSRSKPTSGAPGAPATERWADEDFDVVGEVEQSKGKKRKEVPAVMMRTTSCSS